MMSEKYYLSIADATIARSCYEVEVQVVGPFESHDDALACLVKMARHWLHVSREDPEGYYHYLSDSDTIEVFDKDNRNGYWFISKGSIAAPEDFVDRYNGNRRLLTPEIAAE